MQITTDLTELPICNNSKLKLPGTIGEMEIFHMLPENSIKFSTTHTYLVTGENPVNGWTWLAKMESALCTGIESINKNTTQFPSATFLTHLSCTFHIHHVRHCNSAAKAHIKEIWGVLKSADWMRQVTSPGRKSKYIPSSLLRAANMILAEWICPPFVSSSCQCIKWVVG